MISLQGKRLVIFGCGYVGSALARAALAAGARVEALTRNPDKAVALRTLGLTQVVVGELSSSAWHAQLARGADFVVNCVSAGGGTDGYRQSYVAGQQSILAWTAAGKMPVGTYVYTSSTSVYPQDGGVLVDETAPADGATPNGSIIRESEAILQKAPAAACQRWFILRLAGIYGPGRHHLLDQLNAGATVINGSGEHHLNLAHRDDIVAAILACLAAPAEVANEIFNVADLKQARRGEVVQWLAARLMRPVPAFDGSVGVRRGGVPMADRRISSAKIQRTLGWRPQFPDYRSGYDSIIGTTQAP
jgi:nucleoside-diphosphate-sugar epimerase